MLRRFPDEATHRRTQMLDLGPIVHNIQVSKSRLDELIAQRKGMDDPDFWGKQRPAALQRAIDANDASFAALTDVFGKLKQEVADVEARYVHQRLHLRKLWAGAPAGSMGLYVPVSAASSPR